MSPLGTVNTIMGAVNLTMSVASVVAPEVVDFVRAVQALFKKHPGMTTEQYMELAISVSNDVHSHNAKLQAELDSIDTTKPPKGAG